MAQDRVAITREQGQRNLLYEFYGKNTEFVSEEEYQRPKIYPTHFKALVQNVTDLHQRIGREL
jgi:hypothetical protein